MIDIDNFKQINDIYGHDTGDKVLEQVGIILQRSFRKADFVSRIGGDEFAALIDIENKEQLANTVHRIEENIAGFIIHSSYPFSLHLSIGYDLWTFSSASTQEQFFRHIGQKMYQAKQNKKPIFREI